MSRVFTYGRLRRLLLDLGFTARTVEDSHSTFRHEASDTVLLFGLHPSGEEVRPTDCVKVRRMLDERGLLEGEEFDRLAGPRTGRLGAAPRSGAG